LVSVISLLIFTFLVRMAPSIISIHADAEIHTPLAQLLFHWFETTPFVSENQPLFASLLVFFQGLLLNYTASSHGILYKDTMLPGLFFVLINSIYPAQLMLSPQMIANSFLLLMVFRIGFLYESDSPVLLVFDSGILLGIGILFNYDLLIYLPFILVSIVTMTSFNFRYFLIAVIGILLPAYFMGVYFYLTDEMGPFLQSFEYSLVKSYLNPPRVTFLMLLSGIALAPAVLGSLFHLQGNYFRNRVKTRRIQLVIGIMLIFGIFSLLAENESFVYGVAFLSAPLALITANYYISQKRFWLKEFFFLITLCTLVFNHYFYR